MASLQFLGHSGIKLSLGGSKILIDPCLSERVFFFKRRASLPMNAVDLKVDAIAYTSADWDHLDMFSLKFFPQSVPIIAPLSYAPFINRFMQNPVVELEPWSSHVLGDVTVTAVPSPGTNRRPGSIPRKSVLGYVISGEDQCVYVSGDAGYGPHLAEIGRRFPVTTACLPIGSETPKPALRHLKPSEFLKAAADLGAKQVIPLRREGFTAPFGVNENMAVSALGEIARQSSSVEVKFLSTGESLDMGPRSTHPEVL